jgi:aldose 1-epimerase
MAEWRVEIMADGKDQLFTLANSKGMMVDICPFGGAVRAIKVRDKNGRIDDIVLGFDSLGGYTTDESYFGGLIGRYGNRIAHGQFTLEGQTYMLTINEGENHLHGGLEGFNKKTWTVEEGRDGSDRSLALTYFSNDGEEGYPGNLNVKVVYTVCDDEALKIEYSASTDKNTVLNLTNHSYFNLSGEGNGDILGHELTIYAQQFTPVNSTLIPTGELRNVNGTPFDFTEATAIGARIGYHDEQLEIARGYDHNWVLQMNSRDKPRLAAEVYDPRSGRKMEVLTTEPGLQFYSGNFLDGSVCGKGNKVYNFRTGLCLETQHFPDSPNHPMFPTTELKPGEEFHSVTIYKFSAN